MYSGDDRRTPESYDTPRYLCQPVTVTLPARRRVPATSA